MNRGIHVNPAKSKPALRWLTGLALLLASGAAMALGLGEIRLKSRPGQPLVAEIPIISSDPAEMEQLRVGLASPEVFERVGLSRIQGLVQELDFAVAVSDAGAPVIRVTSHTPVESSAVNFLVEVDWGQGRLVREYSVLVSAPGTVAAVSEPVIDTPAAAPSNTIVRDPEPVAIAAQSEPAQPELPPEPTRPQASPQAPAVAPAPRPPPVQAGDVLAKVRGGQTLSGIASQLRTGQSLNQTMLALLRANPEAFINGNINLLKQGAVLRVPSSDEMAQLSHTEANALVSQQVAQWRQARRPVLQPAAVADAPLAPAPVVPTASAGQAADNARLEIAPALADAGKRKGTTSGQQAGGEGDMLEQEKLQQATEDLASRDSEVQELRAQVAELEKIKQQQQKLIAMKDSDLAAAQQKLAQAQGDDISATWLWGGLALLVAGLVVGWLVARARRQQAEPRSRFDASMLAAATTGMGTDARADADDAEEDDGEMEYLDEEKVAAVDFETDAGHEAYTAAAPVVEVQARELPAAPAEVQQWQQEWTPPSLRNQPTWHAADADSSANLVSLNPAPAGRDRLELAIAYLDLGDKATARGLLAEVAAGGDAEAREQATRLLRELD
ncbi:MAG: FimV/HubP family polar landmark protein [Pseudoxanthomonas sp.]